MSGFIFRILRPSGAQNILEPSVSCAAGFQREKRTIPVLGPVPPPPPKKPANPYVLYLQDVHQEIKKSNPGIHLKDVFKDAAGRWKVLDQSAKQRYIDKFKKSTTMYSQIYSNYLASLTEDQKKVLEEEKNLKVKRVAKRKKNALLKELNKPKRPPGSYALYFTTEMMERKSEPVQDFCKSVAEKWKGLTEDQKKVYQKEAEKKKVAYDADIVKWEKRLEREGKYVNELLMEKSKKGK